MTTLSLGTWGVIFKRIPNVVIAGDNDAPNAVGFRESTLHSKSNSITNPGNSRDMSSKAAPQQIRGEREVRVIVEAPASIANLGPGFDVLAMAIDGFKDVVELVVKPGSGKIVVKVEGIKVPEGKENVAYGVIEEAIERYQLRNMDFNVKVVKGVPPASGLGSSGTTAAATAYAVSVAAGLNLTTSELVRLSGAGEAVVAGTPHYDNVSASILGGVVLIDPAGLCIYKIKVGREFWIAVVSPNIPKGPKKTFIARAVLPRKIELPLLVKQAGSLARLVHALHVGDLESFGTAVSADYVVEPHRAKLIPKYWDLKRLALESGALGFNIAGAGPSVFSIHRSESEAREVGELMLKYLRSSGIDASLYVTKVLDQGVKVLG